MTQRHPTSLAGHVPSEFDRLQAALPERYTLVRELDRGGLSRVYLAREALPDREVAIKVLDEELSAGLGRARFVQDVEVTSKLQHPYILPIHAAGDADGTLYYVMPYVAGESLRDRLDRTGPLPVPEALRMANQVADALQHAHDQGIVHRDLKPSKILFQGGHAVVADFGIARALRTGDREKGFAEVARSMGTADYLSPEQAAGDSPVGPPTDTYALACILFETLAGKPPFHDRTTRATIARHLTEAVPSLRLMRGAVTPEVQWVIEQALAKSPADRPTSVAEFGRALLHAADRGSTEGTRAEPGGIGRGRGKAAGGTGEMPAAAAGIGSTSDAAPGRSPGLDAPPRPGPPSAEAPADAPPASMGTPSLEEGARSLPAAENTESSPARAPAADPPGRRPWRTVGIRRVAAGLVLVGALGFAVQLWTSPADADGAWEASVAVMPFENRTGDPGLDNLGRSLAEEVINRLTTVPELRVIDPYTAASLMNDSLGTPRLLDTLNVEHILHGYVELRGTELILNVSESDLGGFLSPRIQHRIDRDDVDRAQGAVADAVARRFLTRVGLADSFDPGGTVIGPGRDAYLAGNAALGRRTPEGMRDAVVWFREAIRQEPSSAAALSALSSAYALSLYYKYDVGLTAYELAARSLAAADSAIRTDGTVANGYSARGYVRALLGIDVDGAEADFARAEQLAPNAPNGPSWSARILAEKGRIDEAFSEAERARDLDPLQAGRRTALASLGFQLGRYDVTIEEARVAYRLESELSLAKAFEGRALALTGRGAECLSIDFGAYRLVRALCLHTAGREAEARAEVDEAARRLEAGEMDPDYLPELVAQDLASYYGLIGDAVGAERWLRHAFELSPAGVDARILGSALFDPVRNDPRFARAVTEVRAEAQDRVARGRAGLSGPL